ncbi:MAG: hypothetical protein JSV80_05675 [Acidobacteriota bacterium]|nr:MAG: hypothetical protein JSV80_05675 [Acidobacteriota bacterium]
MTSRHRLIVVLVLANLVNAALVCAVLFAEWLGTEAQESPAEQTQPLENAALEEQPPLSSADQDVWESGPEKGEQVLRQLVAELTLQREQLEQKAAAMAERERQLAVVRAELETEREQIEALRAQAVEERKKLAEMGSPSFDRLLKAYEGMEAENAARALAELYERDRLVVVDLLLGLKPRQSAATLDALAAANPKIAAELSYEIWKRDPERRLR